MIRFRDTTTLALTKLRTRKIRLMITIVISGLLFAALVGASMIARGGFSSINAFSKEGLGDRYIVSGASADQTGFTFNDPSIIERATALQKDLVQRKKAEAKRLDIPYDPTTEQAAVQEYDTPSGKQKSVDFQTAAGKQAISEYMAAHPGAAMPEFQDNAKAYGAKAYYTSMQFPYITDGRMQVLKNGKETFDLTQKGSNGPPSGLDSFPASWSLMTRQLLEPFTLPGENLQTGSDGSLPIIVPYSAAEQILGIRALPATASPTQKLERTKEIRKQARNVTFNLCYRNSTSANLISTAMQTQQEIERNKNTKDYKKPDLVYGLPGEPCAAAPVVRDVRTKDQKTLEAKQEQFARIFGTPAPAQQIFIFRLAGIVPDATYQNAGGVNQIVGSLVTSSLGSGWFSPIEEAEKQPVIAGIFNSSTFTFTGQRPTFYAEFPSASQAHSFIDKQNCSPDFSVFDKATTDGAAPDPTKDCAAAKKYFMLTPFGSNSLALESAKKQFGKFFTLAALAVAVVGAVIMMGTVGRMIADSRRETAVFRAIGAKRLDIAQIYLLYTALLSLMVSAFAVLGGAVLAALAQHYFAAGITVQALVAYNARNLDQTFRLYDFYLPDMLLLTALAVGVGLVSVAIPLIRNVRRNPIRDMRDEN